MTRRPRSVPVRITQLSGPRSLPKGTFGSLGNTGDSKPASNALIWGLGGAVAIYLSFLGLAAFASTRRKPRVVRNNFVRF